MSLTKNIGERLYAIQLYLPMDDHVWIDAQVRAQANGCRTKGAVVHRLIEQARVVE